AIVNEAAVRAGGAQAAVVVAQDESRAAAQTEPGTTGGHARHATVHVQRAQAPFAAPRDGLRRSAQEKWPLTRFTRPGTAASHPLAPALATARRSSAGALNRGVPRKTSWRPEICALRGPTGVENAHATMRAPRSPRDETSPRWRTRSWIHSRLLNSATASCSTI